MEINYVKLINILIKSEEYIFRSASFFCVKVSKNKYYSFAFENNYYLILSREGSLKQKKDIYLIENYATEKPAILHKTNSRKLLNALNCCIQKLLTNNLLLTRKLTTFKDQDKFKIKTLIELEKWKSYTEKQ